MLILSGKMCVRNLNTFSAHGYENTITVTIITNLCVRYMYKQLSRNVLTRNNN